MASYLFYDSSGHNGLKKWRPCPWALLADIEDRKLDKDGESIKLDFWSFSNVTGCFNGSSKACRLLWNLKYCVRRCNYPANTRKWGPSKPQMGFMGMGIGQTLCKINEGPSWASAAANDWPHVGTATWGPRRVHTVLTRALRYTLFRIVRHYWHSSCVIYHFLKT